MTAEQTKAAEAYVAKRYKRWRTMDVPFSYKHRKGDRIVQLIEDTGGRVSPLLELGVGPGGIATSVSRHGMKVVGMDLSQDALDRAKAFCRNDAVALLRGSGFSLPFRPSSFRLVYASQVLHLFDNRDRVALMEEVHRVLQPGGRFLFDMKNAWTHAFRYLTSTQQRKRRNFPAASEMVDLLGHAGFTDISLRPGMLPLLGARRLPGGPVFRYVTHTTFFVARRP